MKLQFGQPCHSKKIIEYFEDYHVFNDPVADYMGKKFSLDSGLCFLHKDQIYYHRFSVLCYSVLILIKHDEEVQLLDQLQYWLH